MTGENSTKTVVFGENTVTHVRNCIDFTNQLQ